MHALSAAPAAPDGVIINPDLRSVENSTIRIRWDLNNPESVSELYFKPLDPNLNLTSFWTGSGPMDDEFAGNSWSINDPQQGGVVVVGRGQVGSWNATFDATGAAVVVIDSVGAQGYHVTTTYRLEANSSLIQVQRSFKFADRPLPSATGFRPYMFRVRQSLGFDRYVIPLAGGTIATGSASSCPSGCARADWAGTWADLQAPGLGPQGVGVALIDGSEAGGGIWIDNDANSTSAYIAATPLNASGALDHDLSVAYGYCLHFGAFQADRGCQEATPPPTATATPIPSSTPTPTETSRPTSTPNGWQAPTGYAHDWAAQKLYTFPLGNFDSRTYVGASGARSVAMDFDATVTTLYGLTEDTKAFGRFDLTTGAFTKIATSTPLSGNWYGFAIDPVTNEAFASSGGEICDHPSLLYRIDLTTGAATYVGDMGLACVMDIAISPNGTMYAHDVETDSIYRIDPTNAHATLIGPTGYDSWGAQGMDFDNEDGRLYMALFMGNIGTHFGTVDLATGHLTDLAFDTNQFGIAIANPVPHAPPAEIPEPTPFLLLLAGLAGLGGYIRRRSVTTRRARASANESEGSER